MAKIYHYTKLETALEYILPNMNLKTNSFEKTNDPKENQAWAFGGKNIDYNIIYENYYNRETHIECQYKLGKEIKQGLQIACFVNNEDEKGFSNEMMWAHYANNHKGVCLEIDEEKFIAENTDKISGKNFFKINYGEKSKCMIDWDVKTSKEMNLTRIRESNLNGFLSTKSRYWEHENEKRLIILDNSENFLKINTSLTGIYFGLTMPYDIRPRIDKLITNNETKLYDLYFESNIIKKDERSRGDFRPLINRKFN